MAWRCDLHFDFSKSISTLHVLWHITQRVLLPKIAGNFCRYLWDNQISISFSTWNLSGTTGDPQGTCRPSDCSDLFEVDAAIGHRYIDCYEQPSDTNFLS